MALSEPQTRACDVSLTAAADMVAAQSCCSLSTAVVLMHKRAELIGCSAGSIARAVIKGYVRFDQPSAREKASRSLETPIR
jgi:hypothetical protein